MVTPGALVRMLAADVPIVPVDDERVRVPEVAIKVEAA